MVTMKASDHPIPEKSICGRVLYDEPLSKHTSLGIGGNADIMTFPANEDDIIWLLELTRNEGISFVIIGGGTNVLAKDEGYRGLVINMKEFSSQVECTGIMMYSEAGAHLADVLTPCFKRGLGGLEFASGIPGLIGGAVIGNAGAFGGEFSDIVTAVRGIKVDTGETMEIDASQIKFSYRETIFPVEMVITGVDFTLREMPEEEILKTVKKNSIQRRLRHPLGRTAGSVFKNPMDEPAGMLIEQCDLKGKACGGAVISEVHANFIINRNNATGKDVMKLIEMIRKKVANRFGIELELEWKLI